MSRFTRVARSRVSGQHDVGHEGVITGRDGFSLHSSIADPRGVAQPPLQSTTSYSMYFLTYLLSDKTKPLQCSVCVKVKC
ncbi:hypothetical protein [Lysinibacillus sp. NPDC096212]|uniref:hypothetical protein n=1 Tax=Lysinibacillus sp. NPDC096212 TaxID=3364135 RepID=UPI003805F7D2